MVLDFFIAGKKKDFFEKRKPLSSSFPIFFSVGLSVYGLKI